MVHSLKDSSKMDLELGKEITFLININILENMRMIENVVMENKDIKMVKCIKEFFLMI